MCEEEAEREETTLSPKPQAFYVYVCFLYFHVPTLRGAWNRLTLITLLEGELSRTTAPFLRFRTLHYLAYNVTISPFSYVNSSLSA